MDGDTPGLRDDIQSAIRNGAPLYNSGDVAGCAQVYETCARAHAGDDLRLEKVLRDLQHVSDGTTAWAFILRGYLDDMPGTLRTAADDLIRQGVEKWGQGDYIGCLRTYFEGLKRLEVQSPLREAVLAALQEACRHHSSDSVDMGRAWVLQKMGKRSIGYFSQLSGTSPPTMRKWDLLSRQSAEMIHWSR